jgi:uncharacterized protein YqfB (UPF0267 family)
MMARIFFTKEMKEAVLSGRKTATTRDHQKALGIYDACTGSWRNPKSVKKFAVIDIFENGQNTWKHSLDCFAEEGFNSFEEMQTFAFKTGLAVIYGKALAVYFHRFKVIQTVTT